MAIEWSKQEIHALLIMSEWGWSINQICKELQARVNNKTAYAIKKKIAILQEASDQEKRQIWQNAILGEQDITCLECDKFVEHCTCFATTDEIVKPTNTNDSRINALCDALEAEKEFRPGNFVRVFFSLEND